LLKRVQDLDILVGAVVLGLLRQEIPGHGALAAARMRASHYQALLPQLLAPPLCTNPG
jgi:hypothetical protein